MASLLRVPEVAAGATEAILVEWLVEENSAFSADQPIVVIETDKAVVEVPAGSAAFLLRHLVETGTPVDVGAPMALVGDETEQGSDLDQLLTELGVSTPGAAVALASADTDQLRMGTQHAAPEPETAPEPEVSEASALPPCSTTASAETTAQPETEAAGPAATEPTGRVFASPLARRILRDAGLSLQDGIGTGPGGRIVRRDAERAVTEAQVLPPPQLPTPPTPPARATPPAAAAEPGGGFTDVPHTRMRRAIAARLTASKQTIPHFYVKRTVRIDALLDLRRQLNEVSPQKISVNDLVLRAVGVTHAQVPEANAIWTEDAIRHFDSVDVAIAMASDRGLVTPVLRDVERTSPAAIASRTKEFKLLADEGKLQQRDLEGGSISVTNLGMFSVEEFSAIINPPQSSILAVGAGLLAPTVINDSVQAATLMSLVLSVDHRVIDGALAARWFDLLVKVLEQPLRLLA